MERKNEKEEKTLVKKDIPSDTRLSKLFTDALQLFKMMLQMDADKFEPLTGIEHAHTRVLGPAC